MPERVINLPEGVPPLTQYYVYLTGGCNLACQHCWISPSYQAHGGTGGHLDYDLFALALEEGIPLGLQSVKLTGGEPLLHPDFLRIVDLIKEKELSLTIETNGTLMTGEIARHLKEKSTLGHISVSLDGASAKTHDPFRGVKGSFDRAVQGIKYLVDVGYHPQVIMSLHEDNVGEIEDLIYMSERFGAGSVKFNLIQPAGRGEIMSGHGKALDIYKLVELGEWVERDLQKHFSINLIFDWPMAFRSINSIMLNGFNTCGIFGILGILPSGHIAMCGIGIQLPELCYGILGRDSIAHVWATNPRLQELRYKLPKEIEGICSECIFRNNCLGSCIAGNFNLSGNLTSPYWFCQKAADASIFPLSRCL